MPETLEDLIMLQPPSAERPLLGTIVLVVEDSRHTCEALRLICQRSGARIRRAESLASAERHLRTYRPRLALVDVGLPDGSGLDLIARLSGAEPRIDGIIATSGDDTVEAAAIAAGADVFLPKPIASISEFQQVALSLMPADLRPVRLAKPNQDTVTPEPIALRDDLSLAADLLRTDPDEEILDYLSGFIAGLAKSTSDARLAELADQVHDLRLEQDPVPYALDLAAALDSFAKQLQTV